MHNNSLIAILTGFGGMLGWGLADFFAKKTVDKVGSLISLVWAHLFGTIVLVLVCFYSTFVHHTQMIFPNALEDWVLLILFGALQALVYLLVYEGFSKGKLSILNPIFASYSGLVALISVIVLGEILNIPTFLALALIFGGILLLNLDGEALRMKHLNILKTPGFKEVGMAALLAALWTIFWDKFIGGKDWMTYALLMYISMTIVAFLFSKIMHVKLSVTKNDLWKYFILIGFFEALAYLSISLGYSTTSLTSIVALLSGAFSLPTIILARVFLKEKVHRIHTIGSLIIVVGIIILALI